MKKPRKPRDINTAFFTEGSLYSATNSEKLAFYLTDFTEWKTKGLRKLRDYLTKLVDYLERKDK